MESDPFCGRAECRHLMRMHSVDLNLCQVPDCTCPLWLPAQLATSGESIEWYEREPEKTILLDVLRAEQDRLNAVISDAEKRLGMVLRMIEWIYDEEGT